MLNSRFKQTEERIWKLEDKTIEMTNYEEQKEERMKKNKQSLKDLWYTIKTTYKSFIEVLEGEGRKKDRKNT